MEYTSASASDTPTFYHRHPQRHPRFSGLNYSHLDDRQRIHASNRWSTQLGVLTPPALKTNTLQSSTNSTSTANESNTNVVSDHTSAVESFFASVRIPASFLAATSFTELFAVQINADDTSIQRQLLILCLVCQGISFVLSMNVIVLSTQALTRSLTGNFDPFAETGYEFLFREFHFEFVSVRWSFIVSLYGFLLAVTAKILYAFELFNVQGDHYQRNHLELGIGVCLLMSSLLAHLHSYVNSTMIGWNSLWHMTCDMLQMLVRRGKEIQSPLEPISLVLLFLGLLFLILALIPGAQI